MHGVERLIVFDLDGTLIDSRRHIVSAMRQAFARAALTPPSPDRILSIVGLSLPQAVAALAPTDSDVPALVAAYSDVWKRMTREVQPPLFDGARDLLARLAGGSGVTLAVATGKSRPGLDRLLRAHRIDGHFRFTAAGNEYPSKPHPGMLHACQDATGIGGKGSVMVGDTSFDIDMARAAQMPSIGVAWGFHPVERLSAADRVVTDFDALGRALDLMAQPA